MREIVAAIIEPVTRKEDRSEAGAGRLLPRSNSTNHRHLL
jgi:hypothetical protein